MLTGEERGVPRGFATKVPPRPSRVRERVGTSRIGRAAPVTVSSRHGTLSTNAKVNRSGVADAGPNGQNEFTEWRELDECWGDDSERERKKGSEPSDQRGFTGEALTPRVPDFFGAQGNVTGGILGGVRRSTSTVPALRRDSASRRPNQQSARMNAAQYFLARPSIIKGSSGSSIRYPRPARQVLAWAIRREARPSSICTAESDICLRSSGGQSRDGSRNDSGSD